MTRRSVNQLIDLYLRHAEVYYRRPDGTPTREAQNLRCGLAHLRAEASDVPIDALSRAHVKAVRLRLIERGCGRRYINKVVGQVRRFVRWCVDEDLAPPAALAEVQRVAPLLPGRCAARETSPRGAVDPRHVAAVLPRLTPTVADAVRLLCLTGARLGQVLRLTGGEIVADEPDAWWAIPAHHKTSHRGRRLTIPLDARAIAVVRPRVSSGTPEAPLFPSPRDPSRPYRRDSVARAIARACTAAGVPRWSPHQVRRRVALDVRRRAGLDAAQALLGHADVRTTQRYAPVGDEEARAALDAVPSLEREGNPP